MKSIKLMVLLAVVVAVSCKKNDETYNIGYREYQYYLYLSFQNASGNDLVKGIGFQPYGNYTEDESNGGIVKSDLYTLEVIFPNHWQSKSFGHGFSFVKGKALKEAYPELKYGNYDYLSFMVSGFAVQYGYGIVVRIPFAEKITFKLKCSYIFGDEVEHEMVTWWKEKNKEEEERYPAALCYRIELGGKEFTEIDYSNDEYVSMATVVWENK